MQMYKFDTRNTFIDIQTLLEEYIYLYLPIQFILVTINWWNHSITTENIPSVTFCMGRRDLSQNLWFFRAWTKKKITEINHLRSWWTSLKVLDGLKPGNRI